jgi:heme O synthase-like polyprenyltransferase
MITNRGRAIISTLLQHKILKQGLELTKFKLSLLNGLVAVGSYSLYSAPYSCLPLFASSIALSMSTQALNQYIEI